MKCKKCGQEIDELASRGFCNKCYGLDVEKRKSAICPGCDEEKPIKAKGLCRKCYMRLQRHGDPTKYDRPVKGANLCSYCHEKPVHAKDFCTTCYQRYLHHGSPEKVRVPKITECEYCGEVKRIRGHGFCGTCYMRFFRHGTPEFRPRPSKIRECVVCGETKKIAAKNVCTTCYNRYLETGNLSKVNGQYAGADPIALGLRKLTKKDVERRKREVNDGKIKSRKKNPGRAKNADLKKSFGITIEEYNAILEKQKGVCAICGEKETAKGNGGIVRNLAVDHDHETGEIRGLLCSNCNNGLGRFKDSPNLLTNAIDYLS